MILYGFSLLKSTVNLFIIFYITLILDKALVWIHHKKSTNNSAASETQVNVVGLKVVFPDHFYDKIYLQDWSDDYENNVIGLVGVKTLPTKPMEAKLTSNSYKQ